MAVALPQVGREEQARPPSPARQVTVVALAILDITGVLVTLTAAAVLTLNDRTDRRWWWAVGLASLLAVLTTVLLIQIEGQRRAFTKDVEKATDAESAREAPEQAEQETVAPKSAEEQATEDLIGVLDSLPGTTPAELRQGARALRDALLATRHYALANRLTFALMRKAGNLEPADRGARRSHRWGVPGGCRLRRTLRHACYCQRSQLDPAGQWRISDRQHHAIGQGLLHFGPQ
jgi:hypothetical protein